MKKEKLLELVEALRKAGQRKHQNLREPSGHPICVCYPEHGCTCGAAEANGAVDEALKALVVEIEKAETKDRERKKWVKAAIRTVEDCPEEGCEHCAHIMPLYNQNADTILKEST